MTVTNQVIRSTQMSDYCYRSRSC